ncbi:MAG: DUF927 domain-containing protein [Candidatus Binatia bacterium]
MEQFLRRVLPDGGQYVAVSIPVGAKASEARKLRDIPALLSAVQRLSQYKTNVYFAVGTYGDDRKQPIAKRSIFVDVDPKGYATKPEQIKAIAAFCRATAFPLPSIFVDSGRGIHAYWCFDRDLPVADWKVLADAMKIRCQETGFHADPTVTADAARILRMPGTMNVKDEPPTPCRVLKDTGVSYDPAQLLVSLRPSKSGALAALAGHVGADDLGSAPAGNTYPQVPYYATEIAERCGVMKEALDTGGLDHTEPQWRHLLALLAFCEDGDKLVHEISKGHAGYTPESTDKKWAAVLKGKADGTVKPILCTTFMGYKNSICSVCPHNGLVKTPMVLGKLEATAFLSYPYRMGDYAVQKLVKKADGDIPEVWADVFPYRISDVEAMDPGQDTALQIRMLVSSKKTVTKLAFPHTLMAIQGDGLAVALSNARVFTTTNQLGVFKDIMTAWLRKMTDVKKSVSIELTGLGWGKRANKHAFVAGQTVYTEDGSEYDFYVSDPTQMRYFKPKGDPNVWNAVGAAIAKDPRQAAVTTMLTAFAGPLVAFTGVKGLTFSLYSIGSGPGKSSLLRTAQAVWGHPINGMSMLDDTENSVIHKIGFLNSIPLYWDELRMSDKLNSFIKFIFTLGQGREKNRLTSGITQREGGSWDTLVTLAGNDRLADHVDEIIKASDAGRVRLFEISLPELEEHDIALGRLFDKLQSNYGHTGIVYGKYLATHRAEAESLVQQIQDMLRNRVSREPRERYWIAFVASILAAATLVERAGILKIDRAKLMEYLMRQINVQRTGVEEVYTTSKVTAFDSIAKFIDAHRNRMLLVETFEGTGMSKYGNIITPGNMQPRDEIYILKAVNDHKVRIHRAAWRSWVTTVLKHSPTTLAEELEKMGVRQVLANLSAGMQNASNARVKCLEVDLTGQFAPLIDEEKQ